ncbi:hypothetical protein B0T17DRAFT_596695 [Bombardia bombarda]|uniref:Uncharacterized protein n=1 Tax=Bombardia bombarda TaxID=252184 RepID=A0AA39XQR9_9PEZI|nr:hypothetical protein B0T17DRAFT_596695 [Bombardia bombarda]
MRHSPMLRYQCISEALFKVAFWIAFWVALDFLDEAMGFEWAPHCRTCLRGFAGKAKLIKSRIDFITSWRWKRLEPEIGALSPAMESLKSSLTLVLLTILMDTTKTKIAADTMSHEEHKRLKRHIRDLELKVKDQIETIRQLREEHNFFPAVSEDAIWTSRNSVASQVVDQHLTLCHLAQSMVDNGTVPTSSPETFTFPERRRRRQHRRTSTAHERQSNRNSVTSTTNMPTSEAVRTSRPDGTASRPAPTGDGAQDSASHQSVLASMPPIEPITVTQSPAPSSPSMLPSPLSRRESDATTSASTSASQPDADNTAGLKDDKFVTIWILVGPIWQCVEARIDRRIRVNLIRRDDAEKLGLHVEELGHVSIALENGRMVDSVGRTMLQWSMCSSRKSVAPISCIVCKDLDYPLIFGRPFDDVTMSRLLKKLDV